ncbi:MAG: helix-turn-helix transcriptional regulator, partial [Galactobacillus timonensis]|uniref:helix-turn-helix transcriptional regulator n=1 Tax=Galactobacillus timonensis TaxID=2041840 RepID=UPI0023F39756
IINPIGYKCVMKEKVLNPIATFVKMNRKEAGLTQKEFALRSGLGLRFVRDLEQGKESLRMDKVNQALAMFGMTCVPGKMSRRVEEEPEE